MPTMYLLNTSTLRLERFQGESRKPKYAILSHRWGKDEDEATFQDVNNGTHLRKQGWKKITSACGVARAQGHKYLWADTCCINKIPENNKEQTDAINSMYKWYGASEVCYAYLEDVVDVNNTDELKKSQWFERGWTLQEMLAPEELIFFSQDWKISVDRFDIPDIMSTVAGVVGGQAAFWFLGEHTYTIDDVMSWASRRKTTKPEDAAYSLIGLLKLEESFKISFGEGGAKAFVRLQEQLMQQESYSGDMTIFNWTSGEDGSVPHRSMFATSPKAFGENNRSIVIRMRSDIFEKCKTLIGAIEDEDSGGEEDEGSGDEEDKGSVGEEDEGSRVAIDHVLVAEDGLHMPVWLLELKTPCEKVGNASYEVDLGSVIITENDGVRKTRDAKIFVSEKKGTYYEAFNLVPSFRIPGRLRFYVALMEYRCRGDGEIDGILLVSRENELEKHRVIMNRVIGVSGGSLNGRFSNPVRSEIVIA
jgi:hypothetical protein